MFYKDADSRWYAAMQDSDFSKGELVKPSQETLSEEQTENKKLSEIGSTVPVKNDFDPAEWARDMQKVKVDLAMLDVELKITKEIYDAWFKEIPGEDDVK